MVEKDEGLKPIKTKMKKQPKEEKKNELKGLL
jgi:hypothetical protein